MRAIYLILTLLIFTVVACKNDATTTTETTPPPVEQLPMLPNDIKQMLFTQSDKIDYIFYNLDFSINSSGKSNVQRDMTYISNQPAVLGTCPSFGRQFYQREGVELMQAQLYFGQGCGYMVFYQDKKPAYANAFSPTAMGFFNKLVSQVKTTPQ